MKVEKVSTIFCASKPENAGKKQKNKNLIYGGSALVLTAAAATAVVLAKRKPADKYLLSLAQGLSKELNRTVKPSELKSVMTKEEFLREIPKLKEENFVMNAENIKNGTFLADLHSHSTFSDGLASVQEIMEQAASYGDKLNDMNGKKFIFALTDHDGVEGVKEALKLIAENPDKYKNIKFVPAAELSFIEKCSKGSVRFNRYQSEVQMPEMLIYNINPFSFSTGDFFSELYAKRNMQIEKMIQKANEKSDGYNFTKAEYEKFLDKSKGKHYLLNQHWNIHDYLQLKTRLVDIAREQKQDEQAFFEKTILELKDAERTPGGLTKYLKENNIGTTTPEIYDRISDVAREFFPKIKDGVLLSDYENYYSNIVDYALRENAYLAFAHPGFTMQNFTQEECYEKMRSYVLRSKGTMKFAERFHQAYPFGDSIDKEELRKYHEILDRFKLFGLGGRDNHSGKFL